MLAKVYSLSEIAKIVNGELIATSDSEIAHLSIDSRKIYQPSETIFFALQTDKNDGHKYLSQVENMSVAAVVVNHQVDIKCAQIIVSNTTVALQQLASSHRTRFDIPVVGITGSNGKTVVKEWTHRILSGIHNTYRSPKSYNSQVGVPLSVWGINENHKTAIIEAGISHTGEMSKLQKIVRPTIGVFTHLGTEHIQNFKDVKQLVDEKIILFKECTSIACSNSYPLVIKSLQSLGKVVFTHGISGEPDLLLSNNGQQQVLTYNNEAIAVSLPFKDAVSIENVLSSIATCILLGVDIRLIIKQLPSLSSVDTRLQQVDGINGNQLILDFFNSDLDSLTIALDFLNQQANKKTKTVILSDFKDAHLEHNVLYIKLNKLLVSRNITNFIGVGQKLSEASTFFEGKSTFYSSTDALINEHPWFEHINESILIKGDKEFSFGRISSRLKVKNHETVLEVNLSRLTENLNVLRKGLKPTTKVMAMVKALSYGSGGFQIAKLLEYNGIDYFGVAYTDEAIALRNAGIYKPIMVLNPDLSDLSVYSDKNIQPVIFSKESMQIVENEDINIHIEIDTGMHRLGFIQEDLIALSEQLSKSSVNVISVMSHLAAADDPNMDTNTNKQIKKFKNSVESLHSNLSQSTLKHISNTAGIQRFKDAEFDMVRLGIGMYGVSPIKNDEEIKPVITFKSFISQIKLVKAGEGVGYGMLDSINKDRRIAVVSVGYADGFNRKLSRGNGYFEIKGKKAAVVGNVCMDMTMCDVTDINCKVGDAAIIFGDSPKVEEIAKRLETISYEVLTGVSERVSRIYYQE